MTMFANLTDAALLTMLKNQAEACERVVAMPLEQRQAIGGKGSSPEQAGTMNAVFCILAEREAARRGLVVPVLGDL